jgi:hypothetical protein
LRLMPVVNRAIEHDHRENANLLAAFDLLDPAGDSAPQVMAATRHAAPAAAHAASKFALLAPAIVSAAVVAGTSGTKQWAAGHNRHREKES